MGLFGDFFDNPLFDLDGNGNIDSLEEAIAFDWFLSGGSGSGDIFGNDDDFDNDNDDLFDDDGDDFDSDNEDLFDDDDDIFGDDSFDD